jgi:FtsZ-binding cell division protein ZapB
MPLTTERLEMLRAKANGERAGWVTQREVTELFSEIDSLRAHNQTLADELNDWRDKANALAAALVESA